MKLRRRSSRGPGKRLARTLVPLLPSLVRLLGGLMRDRRVSLVDRGLVVAVLLYVVSPLDLVPDFLGVFGLTDDLFLLALVLRRLLLGAGSEVLAAHWGGSRGELHRLMDSVGDLGSLLPGPVRGLLESFGGR
ncbi:MAG TPA: YkvA family protein [Longimicrobiales bacterium]|nr:YkvA family protein [Longimicrobiales bacterium]